MPESKRLNVLLRDFRANRNHIAIVVDEYGGVSGLVTIEDVLEQIVGDIEDEYDFDESEDNIIAEAQRPLPRQGADRDRRLQRALRHRRSPTTSSTPSAASCCRRSAGCPSAARSTTIGDFRFRVIRADSRRLHTLQVERVAARRPARGRRRRAPDRG